MTAIAMIKAKRSVGPVVAPRRVSRSLGHGSSWPPVSREFIGMHAANLPASESSFNIVSNAASDAVAHPKVLAPK